jgi:ABC-2 type transport system ATP-binding protein
VVLDDGADLRLALDEPGDAARLHELIGARRVRSIHSREPTLAEVFIALTGRSLEDGPAGEEGER